MADGVLSKAGYGKLLKELRALLDGGQRSAQEAVDQVRVRTYWAVGKRVVAAKLSERAGYGTGVVQELGHDLGIGRAVMFRIVAFAQAYPKLPTNAGLSWSQYVDLLAVKSQDARVFYETRALTEGWSRRQLSAAIRGRTFAQAQDDDGAGADGEGRGGKRKRAQLARPTASTHVYEAEVTRVIDGDTVVVEIDLGFDVIRRQKMRLFGVDAAPLDTEDGRAAARFVRERLAAAELCVVKTVKHEDKHGRYLGHLFYSTTPASADEVFETGTHLNAELARRGHAVLV